MPVYREQPAPQPLKPWVECVWTLEAHSPLDRYRVTPDGCLDLIYEAGRSLRVIGAMTVEQRIDIPAETHLTAVRFHPGMAGAVLNILPAELTDNAAPFEDLCPRAASDLRHKLDDCTTVSQAAGVMVNALRPFDQTPDRLRQAIHAISRSHGNADLDQIASQANLSARQFRRRCREECGLSPKLLARIIRFRYASQLVHQSASIDWPGVALDAGYFDQSHLIRDFRCFTHSAPMSVFSKTGLAQLD